MYHEDRKYAVVKQGQNLSTFVCELLNREQVPLRHGASFPCFRIFPFLTPLFFPQDSNWCELYFTLLLKHSALGWRTFCLDYFFNEETLLFMSHSSIEQTYGYMKMHIPRRSLFPMIANIVFNVTFVEVPECSKKGVHERGGAVIKIHSYTVMTAVFCYLAGVMLGVVGWIVVRGLCMTNHEECPSRDGTPASSADSLGTPPPTPLSGAVLNPAPPPPAVIATPEIRTSPPDPSSAPPGTQPPPVDHPGDRPGSRLPPAGERSPRPPTAGRPPPTQQLRLPPVGGQQQQRLSPRHAGLRASFVQWGGAALDSLRAPFVGAGRAARGESRPPPQQGGSRPPQQPRGGSRPSRAGRPASAAPQRPAAAGGQTAVKVQDLALEPGRPASPRREPRRAALRTGDRIAAGIETRVVNPEQTYRPGKHASKKLKDVNKAIKG